MRLPSATHTDGEAQRFCLSALVTMSLGGGESDHLDAMRCDALARIAMSGGVEATVHALQAHFEQKHGKVVLGKSNLLSKFGWMPGSLQSDEASMISKSVWCMDLEQDGLVRGMGVVGRKPSWSDAWG
jgi:hypothetical protein